MGGKTSSEGNFFIILMLKDVPRVMNYCARVLLLSYGKYIQ